MRFRNIFWGIILIVIGLLFTLQNLNVIDFDWYNLWRMWPVILILWGVSILPVKNLFKTILVILVVGGTVFYMLDNNVKWEENRSYSYRFDFDDDDDYSVDQNFKIPLNDSIKVVNLDMEVAAGSFYLFERNTDLANFKKTGASFKYKYTVMQRDTTSDLNIFIEDDFTVNKHKKNTVDLGLSQQPVWDMSFDVGAAKAEFDMSKLKLRKLNIEGGAASIDVKLGDNYDRTEVWVETGASSFKIKVPEDSGCELNVSSVLSGKTIKGFEKIDHGNYRTSNFDTAKNKIYINLEAAVSSYTIIRY